MGPPRRALGVRRQRKPLKTVSGPFIPSGHASVSGSLEKTKPLDSVQVIEPSRKQPRDKEDSHDVSIVRFLGKKKKVELEGLKKAVNKEIEVILNNDLDEEDNKLEPEQDTYGESFSFDLSFSQMVDPNAGKSVPDTYTHKIPENTQLDSFYPFASYTQDINFNETISEISKIPHGDDTLLDFANDNVIQSNSMIMNITNKDDSKLKTSQVVSSIDCLSNNKTLLKLSSANFDWLSLSIIDAFNRIGIDQIYKWQADCLAMANANSNKSFVYTAPTSAGKSLVADILMMNSIITLNKKAMIIVPFTSLVLSKEKYLNKLFPDMRIGAFCANRGVKNIDELDIIICTLEKGNGLINKMITDNTLNDIGVIVADELHILGEPHRGYILELALAKCRFATNDSIKIIGMSATLPNVEEFASWLNADYYNTNFRPIPLFEYYKIGDTLYDSSNNVLTHLKSNIPEDPDFLVSTIQPVIDNNGSVLVFCNSREQCRRSAFLIAKYLKIKDDEVIKQKRDNILKQLHKSFCGLDPELQKLINVGIAYHHAALTLEEREIIEEAFSNGGISVLACTTTLSLGINLPARAVIFRDIKAAGKFLTSLNYQQIKGRAGRKGLDIVGESVLMCRNTNDDICHVKYLLDGKLDDIKSSLDVNVSGMKRAILEILTSKLITSIDDIDKFIGYTKISQENRLSKDSLKELKSSSLKYLTDKLFTTANPLSTGFEATKFGIATVTSSLPPEEALVIYDHFKSAIRALVLLDDLHIIYQVTPIYFNVEINWNQYLNIWNLLSDSQRYVAEVIGIKEKSLYNAVNGVGFLMKDSKTYKIYERFYKALILSDLINEKPFDSIISKFKGINRGSLQSLQLQSAMFAGQVRIFLDKLGWSYLGLIIDKFSERLQFGVSEELLDIARIPSISRKYARILWNEGVKSIEELIEYGIENLTLLILDKVPFDSSVRPEYLKDLVTLQATKIHSEATALYEEQTAEEEKELIKKKSILSKQKGIKLDNKINSLFGNCTKFKIYIIKNTLDIECLVNEIKKAGRFSWNASLEYNKIKSIYFYCIDSPVVEIPISSINDNLSIFQDLFSNKNLVKVSCDIINEIKILLDLKIAAVYTFEDPLIALWSLEPDNDGNKLAKVYKDIVEKKCNEKVPFNMKRYYLNTYGSIHVIDEIHSQLQNAKLLNQYTKIEMKIAPALGSMMYFGLSFSHDSYIELKSLANDTLKSMEKDLYTMIGNEFNIQNPNEVAEIIYDKLALRCSTDDSIGTTNRSTKKDILSKLDGDSPVVNMLLATRRLSKLMSTIVLPLGRFAKFHNTLGCTRIFYSYSMFNSTGRVVTVDPNLQTLPSTPEQWSNGKNQLHLRDCIIASKGMVLLSADYSQLELRILAHLSGDNILIEKLTNGLDFFKYLASKVFKIKEENVSDNQRKIMKCVSYGVIYGMGTRTVADRLETSIEKAQEIITQLQESYKGLSDFKQKLIKHCELNGYVQTILGRKRYVPLINDTNSNIKAQAERQAINSSIQGSAADLLKVSIIDITSKFTSKGWGVTYPNTNKPRMLFQVHDEIVFEVPDNMVTEVSNIVSKVMTNSLKLNVPITVNIKSGRSWGQLKSIK